LYLHYNCYDSLEQAQPKPGVSVIIILVNPVLMRTTTLFTFIYH